MQNAPFSRALGALVLTVVATAGVAAPKPAKTAPATKVPGLEQVQATTLANGMRVIV